jgi:hypothetical protein
MTTESDPIRQQEWAIAVRRSFGIPDLMSHEDARMALVELLESELRENGWLSAPRAVAIRWRTLYWRSERVATSITS